MKKAQTKILNSDDDCHMTMATGNLAFVLGTKIFALGRELGIFSALIDSVSMKCENV